MPPWWRCPGAGSVLMYYLNYGFVVQTVLPFTALWNYRKYEFPSQKLDMNGLMQPSLAMETSYFPLMKSWLQLVVFKCLMSERIKCSIPLVDNHINIHCAIHAVCWNFGQIHVYFTAFIQYASNDSSYLTYKYTTLATRQRDVVVVRTALTRGRFRLAPVPNILLWFSGWTTCFLETVCNGVQRGLRYVFSCLVGVSEMSTQSAATCV